MSLLERVITAHRCRSTHHYIAIDALSQIEGPDAEKWRNLILVHNEELLKGAKAPDAKFKDFKNHVLHIGEGEWGGARDKAMEWYGEAVDALRAKKWGKAIYALGVMSHYYADPVQPFHTGQTEEEGSIHRALEWSVAKSRSVIKERIEEKGYPKVAAGDGPGFVSDMVRAGAEQSHPHYQTLLDHYDIHAGAKNPQAGLDQTLIDIFAELIAYATAGVAVLFSRAIKEAGVKAPNAHITLPGYLATLDIPIRWISKKFDDANDKHIVETMYKELQKTGKVIKNLPDDDKAIRKLHARQVLRKPLKELDAQELRKTGTKHKPRPAYEGLVKASPEADAKPAEPRKSTSKKVANAAAAAVAAAQATKPAKPTRAEKQEQAKAKAEAKRQEKETAKQAKADAAAAKRAAKLAEAEAKQAAIEAEAARKAEEKQAALDSAKAEKDAAKSAKKAEKEAEEAAQIAEREAAEAAKQAEMEAAVKAKDEEEARKRLAESQQAKKQAAEAADRAAQEEIQREEEARLEAEEEERIAAEDARMVAAEAERRKLIEEEAARMAADEAEHRAAMEADRLASEANEDSDDEFPVDEAYYEDDEDEGEAEFSLEELAAFETNLTDNGDVADIDEEDAAIEVSEDAPAIAARAEAPPVSSFFENEVPADVRSGTGLSIDAPVVDAPSIGKKTAKRLAKLGVETVGDLLECDIEEIAFELDVRHIDEQTLIDWQDQAMLMIDVPGLRVHDAQILVGSGIRSAEDLSSASAEKVFRTAMGFLSTPDGARVVRDDHVLKQDEVDDWIGMAREAKTA